MPNKITATVTYPQNQTFNLDPFDTLDLHTSGGTDTVKHPRQRHREPYHVGLYHDQPERRHMVRHCHRNVSRSYHDQWPWYLDEQRS